LKLSREGWTGLAALAASLVLFALTLDLKPNPLVPIGPGFYPRIVLGLSAVLAAVLVVFDLLSRRAKSEAAIDANYRLVLLVFVVFGVYVGLMPGLGFRISTFLFVAVLQSLLQPPKGAKDWIVVLATALITAGLTHLLFERYLSVLLPRGRWTDF
jgi:putative tricarboxylic transport membrane protein